MPAVLTDYENLCVLTAAAIQRYQPAARSDPFMLARMCNRFRLHVESPSDYADYVKYAAEKRREAARQAASEGREQKQLAKPVRRRRPRRKTPAATTPPAPQ